MECVCVCVCVCVWGGGGGGGVFYMYYAKHVTDALARVMRKAGVAVHLKPYNIRSPFIHATVSK